MRRAAIVLVALVVTACGQPQVQGQSNPAPGAAPISVAPSSVAPTTTTVPTPTRPKLPKAADGTDIAACYDGSCEVEVRAPLDIPLDPKTGIRTLTLESVTAQGAKLSGRTTTGTHIESMVFADPGGVAITTFDNKFSIAALGVDKGVVVLRLSPV